MVGFGGGKKSSNVSTFPGPEVPVMPCHCPVGRGCRLWETMGHLPSQATLEQWRQTQSLTCVCLPSLDLRSRSVWMFIPATPQLSPSFLSSITSLRIKYHLPPLEFLQPRGPENPNVNCAFKHARCWQLFLQLWLPRNLFVPPDPWRCSLMFTFIWGLHLCM